MVDIFLSYAQKDKARVKPLADALEAEGSTVWRDRKTRPGETWAQVLDREFGAARCMIAVWSEVSVASAWVQEEAGDGWRRGVLISVRLDPVEIQRGIRRQQAADLTSWDGEAADPEFRLLVEGNTAKVPPTREPKKAGAAKPRPGPPPTSSDEDRPATARYRVLRNPNRGVGATRHPGRRRRVRPGRCCAGQGLLRHRSEPDRHQAIR